MRISSNQRLNLCDLDATDSAALKNFDFQHARRLTSGFLRVPYKMNVFSGRSTPPSLFRLSLDLSSYHLTRFLAGWVGWNN